ncbi:ubiquitin-conjugating enzyme E2Q-like protein 1 [Chiloscyllium plagiosum]|uniref:ubiquitin-conjugating enzyme E2Q-like protein 1 n=1 Tax=Chiloscyllium plagiosum TaxID=36176 RepID=UPI001CB860A8|nr:ubiquitin-conjugating enzyme E2Q-like protein 1 [Chiloscyllium plagiosum]
MATLLRKIGLIRLHDRDTDGAKHQGSRKAPKSQKNASKQCNSSNESILLQSDHHHHHYHNNHQQQHSHKRSEQPPPSIKDSNKDKQQAGSKVPPAGSSSSSSSIPGQPPNKQHCAQVRSRRLMKELQDIRKLTDHFISVELVEDNLFEWNVKLLQVDKDSALWQDMKETSTECILLNLNFPDNFPFSPPFMRVLSPRLENGYVLDGGAICMELLTPRGWSSAYTVEAVMRQFAASLVKGQGRICRKVGKTKKAFTRKEAEATFKSLVKTHEKYGWVTPPVSDG